MNDRHSAIPYAGWGWAAALCVAALSAPVLAQPASRPPSAHNEPRPLFTPVGTTIYTSDAAGDPFIRSRPVEIDFAPLDAIEAEAGGVLLLNLFRDASLTVVIETVASRLPGRYSLAGHCDSDPDATVHLVVHDGVLVGVVRAGNGETYDIRYSAEQVQIVHQADPRRFGECATGPEQGVAYPPADPNAAGIKDETGSGNGNGTRSGGVADDGSTLDVLVVYSNVTRQAAGGTSAIEATVQLAVDVANAAYANSAIAPRLQLVHTQEVSYDEIAFQFSDHLDRLWGMTDGDMDGVHELRERVGADIVSLIVEDNDPDVFGNGVCGIAPVMQTLSAAFERDAFSVVNRDCSADNWSLAHEVGHNQGCAHNRENASVNGLYSYSYGHRFAGTDGNDYRTIMSYIGSGTWERIAYFSNPSVSFQGTPTGLPIGQAGEAHNAATINSSRFVAAQFRQTRAWVDFGWGGLENGLFETPYNTLAAGIAGACVGGQLVFKAGNSAATATISTPLLLNSYGGSAIIGR